MSDGDDKKKCRIAFGIFEGTVDCPANLDPDSEEFRDHFVKKFKRGGVEVTDVVAT